MKDINFDILGDYEDCIINISRNKRSRLLVNEQEDNYLISNKKDILLSKNWSKLNSFNSLKEKETQIKYYKKMNSTSEVLQLVELESKAFGSISENIIKEIFNLNRRISTQNDASFEDIKFEIKSARYWGCKDECVWQHLEPEHDYQYVLFCLLDFDKFKVWIISKKILMGELRIKKIVTHQGKQGWWVKKSNIINYIKPVFNFDDIYNYIKQ
jgi:hypothetical protein